MGFFEIIFAQKVNKYMGDSQRKELFYFHFCLVMSYFFSLTGRTHVYNYSIGIIIIIFEGLIRPGKRTGSPEVININSYQYKRMVGKHGGVPIHLKDTFLIA